MDPIQPVEAYDIHDDTATDVDDSMITPDHTIHLPPTHLQARLKGNNAKLSRRSSASTSRRNSLSSIHSHASSVRGRNARIGVQTHYIAQHLRRASIIETRKARLADRAAHAEEVRLRAAIAKNTPRASNSEEKALAAQLAKEKYLAKVAAACAEEVARAKRIAEEVKERKQQEEVKARMDMEERHAEAERRRAEYLRNINARRARRADSNEKKLAVVEEDTTEVKVIDKELAAKRIQRAWRSSHYRAKVTAFIKLDLNAERSVKKTFDEMTEVVANSKVISTTTSLLTHIGLQQANDSNAALNTRTFLSAYMLVGHPSDILNNKNGVQEEHLVKRANELISTFEDSLARLAHLNNYRPGPMQIEALSQSYTAYTSAFAAWRLQDSSILIEGMVAQFVELDAIWQTVKDEEYGGVSSDYRDGIRNNQIQLLTRIHRLAGKDRADTLIKKAIRESRSRRPKRRAVAEVRPRGVEPVAVEAISHQSDELSRLFTAMPSNRTLTHELAIDKNYKLTEDKSKTELRDQVYRSICDSMKLGFKTGEAASWTISAAENIREKLLRMLKPGNSMHTVISEALDLDQINRQCQAGVFSYDGFFDFMAKILPKLCAPYRDDEVRKLVEQLTDTSGELDAMTNKLFNLLRMVDKLSLDYSNFILMQATPTLIKEAAGYESRLFANDISTGQISLERTATFWREAATSLAGEADRRDVARLGLDRPPPHKIYAKALVDLAVSQDELEQVPETLTLDLARIKAIRAGTLRVVVMGGIFLTAKNLLKRDARTQWKTEATRMWSLIMSEGYEGTGEVPADQKAFSILETAHNMPSMTKTLLSSAISRFFAQAAARRLTDPMLKVLHARVKTHILNRLNATTTDERVRAASSAAEILASCGLSEFTPQVASMVDTLEKIRHVDWSSHGVWYEQIANEGM